MHRRGPTLGIIADGAGDVAAFRRTLVGALVVLGDGPRGHGSTATSIASAARKQVLLLAASGCERVLLVTDFEERRVSYTTFCDQLETELKKHCPGIEVYAAVPNIMLENWMLADTEQLSSKRAYIRKGLKQKPYEGLHGKRIIKSMMLKGVSYSETAHGPQLLATVRVSIATANSDSFARFRSLCP